VSARTAWLRAVLVLGLVVGADQLTKHLVRASIGLDEHRHVAPGIELVHLNNSGVAFSALSGAGWVVPAVIAVAIAALLVYFVRNTTRPGVWLACGLLLGGAAGNAIDRIVRGSVTDFVKLPHWPAFNVADSAITVGVIVLVFALERRGRAADR
jgi:signal peptidase II